MRVLTVKLADIRIKLVKVIASYVTLEVLVWPMATKINWVRLPVSHVHLPVFWVIRWPDPVKRAMIWNVLAVRPVNIEVAVVPVYSVRQGRVWIGLVLLLFVQLVLPVLINLLLRN
jgi:hypothetical protein